MNVVIVTTNDKEQWDTFVVAQPTGSFLQSWDWGDFNSALGKKVWRIAIEKDGVWQAVCLITQGILKFNLPFLYAPRGPVVAAGSDRATILKTLNTYIDELVYEIGAVYAQLEPYTNDDAWKQELLQLGYRPSVYNVQPGYTLVMSLTRPTEDLLREMHSKTRYNIRLAEKKGVTVVVDNTRVGDFYTLLQKTEQRQGVHFFSRSYFEQLATLPGVFIYLAEYEGIVVASNIMVMRDGMATYLFGGTDYTYRKVMAPQLLQWQAMKDAKDKGCTHYDFWGAVPEGVTGPESKWKGVTRFKQGFAPKQPIEHYLGTYEKVYRPIVRLLYTILKKVTGRKG